MLKKTIKLVDAILPWAAFAAALATEFAVAVFVFRHNTLSVFWELYLDFVLLALFIFTVDLFAFKKRRNKK